MASLREALPLNMPQDLIQTLLARQEISSDQLKVATLEAESTHQSVESSLVALGFISEKNLAQAQADVLGVDYIDLARYTPKQELLDVWTPDQLLHYQIFPLALTEGVLLLGMVDIHHLPTLDYVKLQYAQVHKITPALITPSSLQAKVESLFEKPSPDTNFQNHSISSLLETLLRDANQMAASDIHFEPEVAYTRVRYRLDGLLKEVSTIHRSQWKAMCVRIKVLSGMNIAESRRPQNGRLSWKGDSQMVDVRVASHPVVNGENLVLRILDPSKSLSDLDNLGYSPEVRAKLQKAIDTPEGMIVLTGPTGCGKTTSLYAMIQALNTSEVNIMTLEDPVEYTLPRIRQTQVQPTLTFPDGIKSILRQDPDIILVGEIRDEETAQMAMRASMTGHKVLTTLHTRHALGAVGRLQDLGVKDSSLAENLTAVISQRLIRRLCKRCKAKCDVPAKVSRLLKLPQVHQIYQAKGCTHCNHTGYAGRRALAEVLFFSYQLRSLIAAEASEVILSQTLKKERFRTLQDEVREAVRAGETSVEEAQRTLDLGGEW